MIQVRRIKAISPEWEAVLDERARASLEWAASIKYDAIKSSTAVWLLSYEGTPVFFCGLNKCSLMGNGAEMWFMTCKDTSRLLRRTTPFLRRAIRRVIRLYGRAKSHVEVDFTRGQRFVEYFGFTKVGEFDGIDDKKYFVYEQRASWQ